MKLNGWLPAILFAVFLIIIGYYYFKKKASDYSTTIVSFMGAPGSGKGTLAEKCVKDLNCYKSLSTGNLLREVADQETDLGKEVQSYMEEGKLVPDTMIVSIVQNWLNDHLKRGDTLILDGFPRTAKQAKLFLKLLRSKFNNVSFRVFNFTISDERIMQRLSDRLICEKCQAPYSRRLLKDPNKLVCTICGGKLVPRQDDTKEIIRSRLKEYAEKERPLLEVYESLGIKVDKINVEEKNPQQIFDEFKMRIKD